MQTLAKLFPIACAAALLGAALPARAAGAGIADGVVGKWYTEDGRGVIAIEPCGDALCGRIVGISRDANQPMPTDTHGNSQCGLTIIRNERPEGDGSWLGEVTDPRTGTTYGAKLWLDGRGNLRLRGFLGLPMLGATQTWRPFSGELTAACEPA
jgi:uncharacterized protein (DUF2147 family)